MSYTVSDSVKALNRIEFDRVTNILTGQSNVLSMIKQEILNVQKKYNAMINILKSYPDEITLVDESMYDVQAQAFIHALFMYLSYRDSNNNLYINPVTQTSTSTDVSLTINYNSYTDTSVIATVDNISVDIYHWIIAVGTSVTTALKAADIQTQYDTTVETPTNYFSQEEFGRGVNAEIEKLMMLYAHITKIEQLVNSSLRYISDLKSMGLYN